MLGYKAWRETRVRWAISVAVLAWACAVIIFFQNGFRGHAEEPLTFAAYLWTEVYKGSIRDLFVVLTIGLGLGGLLQERKRSTAGFTLALPVSRSRLIVARALVGFVELVSLALVPALLFPLLSPLVGESYPFAQSFQFGVLWVGGGTVVFSAAFLLSVALAGEYSAWIVTLVVLTLYALIVNTPALARYPALDIFKIMNGRRMPYFRFSHHLLIGPLPWFVLLALGLCAASFVVVADRVTKRQDF